MAHIANHDSTVQDTFVAVDSRDTGMVVAFVGIL